MASGTGHGCADYYEKISITVSINNSSDKYWEVTHHVPADFTIVSITLTRGYSSMAEAEIEAIDNANKKISGYARRIVGSGTWNMHLEVYIHAVLTSKLRIYT